MGDLNADNIDSNNDEKSRIGIKALASSPLVNSEFATGAKIPTSNGGMKEQKEAVSYTHLTLPTILRRCRSRWSPYH